MSSNKSFVKNLIYASGTQILSMVVSLLMVLGVPKILSVEDYGYWQLFIFYTSYIGFFLFGFSDGLYLKHGGEEFGSLNKRLVVSKFFYVALIQLIPLVIVLAYLSYQGFNNSQRGQVLFFTSIFLVIGNLSTILGFLLLSTNQIKSYSSAVLVEKCLFLITILSFFMFPGSINYVVLILSFVLAKLLFLILLTIRFKSFWNSDLLRFSAVYKSVRINVIDGFPLMISNIASTLILGVCRYFIDLKWDIVAFGQVSLAISATYFLMLLTSQVSLVLFPVLRKMTFDKQRTLFQDGDNILTIIMCGFLVFYFPLYYLLMRWVPNYEIGIRFLVILFPMCIFEAKVQILYGTFMKTFNKQNKMLIINIVSLTISIFLSGLGAFVFNSLEFVIYAMLISLAIRCMYVKLYLSKFFDLKVSTSWDLFFTSVFLISCNLFSYGYAVSLYASIYLLYIFINRHRLCLILSTTLISRFKSKAI